MGSTYNFKGEVNWCEFLALSEFLTFRSLESHKWAVCAGGGFSRQHHINPASRKGTQDKAAASILPSLPIVLPYPAGKAARGGGEKACHEADLVMSGGVIPCLHAL